MEREKFFEDGAEYLAKVPYRPKISTKLLYLAPLRRYKQVCVLSKKLKWSLRAEYFNEIYLASSMRYKQSCVLLFLAKLQKFKMAMEGESFCENGANVP